MSEALRPSITSLTPADMFSTTFSLPRKTVGKTSVVGAISKSSIPEKRGEDSWPDDIDRCGDGPCGYAKGCAHNLASASFGDMYARREVCAGENASESPWRRGCGPGSCLSLANDSYGTIGYGGFMSCPSPESVRFPLDPRHVDNCADPSRGSQRDSPLKDTSFRELYQRFRSDDFGTEVLRPPLLWRTTCPSPCRAADAARVAALAATAAEAAAAAVTFATTTVSTTALAAPVSERPPVAEKDVQGPMASRQKRCRYEPHAVQGVSTWSSNIAAISARQRAGDAEMNDSNPQSVDFECTKLVHREFIAEAVHSSADAGSLAPNGDQNAASGQRFGPGLKVLKTTATCRKIVSWSYFDTSVMILIGFSSLCSALRSPDLDPESGLAKVLNVCDDLLSCAYATEATIQIVAYGAWRPPACPMPGNPPPFLRSGWNWVDCIVAVAGIVDLVLRLLKMVPSGYAVIILRSMRLPRMILPLRTVTWNKGLSLLVHSFMAAIPTLCNMVLIAFLFYFGFGILFINILKGSMWHCSLDPTGSLRPDIDTKTDCLNAGGHWQNAASHFDDLGASLRSLLHIGSGEGWIDVMLSASNSRGQDLQPRSGSRLHLGVLVIIFFGTTHFFVLNLFVGVLVDQYMVTKADGAGFDVLTATDRQWRILQRDVFLLPGLLDEKSAKARASKILKVNSDVSSGNMMTRFLKRTENSIIFKGLVALNIFANTALLISRSPTASKELQGRLTQWFLLCQGMFFLEISIRVAVHKRDYFREAWNAFDVLMVCASAINLLVAALPNDLSHSDIGMLLSALPAGHILRLPRLRRFSRLVANVTFSLGLGLFNVFILIGLIIFLYACMGVQLFGTVMEGEHIGRSANFRTFGEAILLLLRVSTGENWHLLMDDIVSDRAGCTSRTQTYDEYQRDGPRGCGSILGYPYFSSYVVVVKIVLVNLIIGIVLDGFTFVQDIDATKDFSVLMKHLVSAWRRRDTLLCGFLPFDSVTRILAEVLEPVGYHKRFDVRMRQGMKNMTIYKGCELHFCDVVLLSARRCHNFLKGERETELHRANFDLKLLQTFVASYSSGCQERMYDLMNGVPLTVGHLEVARQISKHYLRRKEAGLIDHARLKLPRQISVAKSQEQLKQEQRIAHLLSLQKDMRENQQLSESTVPLSPLPWPPPLPKYTPPPPTFGLEKE
eukprot:TRINITY_DN43828_c0_g1_i1.p1 TRINITY_DN43828_c0_g1~~TRINITY_DN43828_c0_g1_i1.p1  ORF type:complete len:1217 (-),score=173.85 TRINITY_DN43828_c0_g1_i1:14-3556(-)